MASFISRRLKAIADRLAGTSASANMDLDSDAAPSASANRDIGSDVMPSPYTPEHVYRAAVLLTRLNIPRDLIPEILDFAGFYVTRWASIRTDTCRIDQSRSGFVHASASMPLDVHPKSIRAIIFETKSRDQGWSWDNEHHGTYDGSFTWLEAGLIEAQMSEHGDSESDENDQLEDLAEPSNLPDLHKSRRIVTNVHAGKDFKTHHVRWERSGSDDPWMQNLFAQLQAGSTVGIKVFAIYPAWVNNVERTCIGFDYLPVRRID